ncbi:MAG: hypothetical protein ACLPY1_06240 [Terracidiphilus sp.]
MSDFNPPLPPYPPAPALPPNGYAYPMTFGQILDRIFRLVRSNLRPFLIIGVFPIGVLFAFYAVFFAALFAAGVFQHPQAQPNTAAMLSIILPMVLFFIPVISVIYGLYYGASTFAAVQADNNVKVTAGDAFRHAWSKLGRYVWLMVLRSLIISIPIAVVAFAIGVGGLILGLYPRGGNSSPAALFFLIPLFILFYLGAIVYAVIMTLRLSLAFPACVRENLTAMQSIKRSGVLSNGAKGRIFLVLLIIYAISSVFVMVLYAVGLFVFAIAALAGMGHTSLSSPITIALAVIGVLVVLALIFVWSAVLMAAYSTAFAVFYRDQYLRNQGPPPLPIQVVGPA